MSNITEELEKDIENFKSTTALFDDIKFNLIPFKGSWTAGQVAAHIWLSAKNMPVILSQDLKPAGRDPEFYVNTLRSIFLDFDAKFIAAEVICPVESYYNINDVCEKTLEVLQRLVLISETENLTMLCTSFEFPNIGQLTRLEILNFISIHTQRHIRQMQNIRKFLK